jgi:hypothetical protein
VPHWQQVHGSHRHVAHWQQAHGGAGVGDSIVVVVAFMDWIRKVAADCRGATFGLAMVGRSTVTWTSRSLDLATVASPTVAVPQSQDRPMTRFDFCQRALLALAVLAFRLACEHASRAAH